MIEPEKAAAPNPLSDPNAMEGMMDGMKKQVVMMVPNFAIMAWVRSLFPCCSSAPFARVRLLAAMADRPPCCGLRDGRPPDQLLLLGLRLQ